MPWLGFLTGGEVEPVFEAVVDRDRGSMDEPIAVVGLGCRLPGDIHGPESLWEFLSEGRSAVGEVPPDRWASFDDGSPEVAAALAGTTRWGSFLSEVDAFDADFFEISPREAAKMDPQQRLLLEVAHEALEHAGIPADSLRQTQTGVFAGACLGEYGYLASTDLSQVDAWSGTGGALSIIANRVSYFFDLRGPSVTVDTACSSSLVAVHLACQSLRAGDSNLALAAGVNLLLSPAVTRSFDQAEAMSRSGQCHAFDAGADGFVRGEGCGVVVLKRLSDALRDGDRVLAVVRGSAVNQDGRSNGLMAPNPAAQMAVLRARATPMPAWSRMRWTMSRRMARARCLVIRSRRGRWVRCWVGGVRRTRRCSLVRLSRIWGIWRRRPGSRVSSRRCWRCSAGVFRPTWVLRPRIRTSRLRICG